MSLISFRKHEPRRQRFPLALRLAGHLDDSLRLLGWRTTITHYYVRPKCESGKMIRILNVQFAFRVAHNIRYGRAGVSRSSKAIEIHINDSVVPNEMKDDYFSDYNLNPTTPTPAPSIHPLAINSFRRRHSSATDASAVIQPGSIILPDSESETGIETLAKNDERGNGGATRG